MECNRAARSPVGRLQALSAPWPAGAAHPLVPPALGECGVMPGGHWEMEKAGSSSRPAVRTIVPWPG